MELLLSMLIGVGLSATVGFRIFTPLLVTSLAAKASMVTLASGFEWIESTPALIAFLTATIIEGFTYYIPFINNLISVIAIPAAAIAGVLLTASFIGEMSPLFTWGVAIIAGGGVATTSQATMASVRTAGNAATMGIGYFFISIFEGLMAIIMSILSVVAPFIVVTLFIILFFIFIVNFKKIKQRTISIFNMAR